MADLHFRELLWRSEDTCMYLFLCQLLPTCYNKDEHQMHFTHKIRLKNEVL